MDLETMNKMATENQLSGALGISMVKIEDKSVTGTLTVDHRHLRPGNIMNGGVSLVLIETIGSFSSYLLIDSKKQNSFGIQVSANHLSIARPGDVLTAKSEPIHLGRTTHIWDVNITNQNGKLVSSGRITMLVTDNPK
ncbi:PaaI family thioesterase [Peredibacter starrii]|uniref:PaaI family thioesterase n=1 Tax=Peredibacter starrii TaxID=28202 RepID=A0AAX4HLR4_9BACT|nr:PaaI family thioesterase [Peredibacter starrii]WPU64140.1 PaaI family thioesterase [Peredibacter starrii]